MVYGPSIAQYRYSHDLTQWSRTHAVLAGGCGIELALGSGHMKSRRTGHKPGVGEPVAQMTTSASSPEAMFLPAIAKLWIASVDDPGLRVEAQFNPKELQIEKQIPWHEHNGRNNRSVDQSAGGQRNSSEQADQRNSSEQAGQRNSSEQADQRNSSEQADLEYNGGPTRSMTIELLFDGYETKISVEPKVQLLEQMSEVQNPEAAASARRPHQCLVGWGAIRPFLCVIESLVTKYTMWDRMGQPLRATCTLKLKEANLRDSSTTEGGPGRSGGRSGGGSRGRGR